MAALLPIPNIISIASKKAFFTQTIIRFKLSLDGSINNIQRDTSASFRANTLCHSLKQS